MLRRCSCSLQRAVEGALGSTVAWKQAESAARGHCTDQAVLQPSIIPTRHFQRSLPRLPIPRLSNSLTKYAAAVKPLVPPAQYDRTVTLLKEFEAKGGANLQDELIHVDRANQHTSFISSDWFEKVLKERDPIPMRRSRTLFVRSPEVAPGSASQWDMLSRATLWVRSSVLYYKAYLDNTLSPDVRYRPDDAKAYYEQEWFERTVALCTEYVSAPFMTFASGNRAFPLDMSQYDNLFNSTRAPGVLQDEVRAVGFMPHIVVQYRGRQFAVTVADEDSNPLPEDQIYARLRAVVTSPAASSRPRVEMGVFTTLPRTEWNGVRTALLRNTTNQKSLETLDSSMFVLNLDAEVHEDFFQNPQMTVKNGVAKAGNRWWDKSFSVNVSARGSVSVTYEESWGDGAAVRRYVEDVFQHSTLRTHGGTGVVDSSKATEPVRELVWSLSPDMEQRAAKAQRAFQQEVARLDSAVAVIDAFAESNAGLSIGRSAVGTVRAGGDATRSISLSAARVSRRTDDSIMQLALQLAWWRLYKSPVAAVQPVAMNVFRRGRLDGVLPSSTESQAFVLAMTAGNASGADRKELCKRACTVHNAATKEAESGAGILAHFAALKNVSVRMHGRVPAVFSDPSFHLLTNPQLVAIPEGAPSLTAVTANPVSNGYGVAYTTISSAEQPHACVLLNVSAWKGADGPRYSTGDFTAAVSEAISDIRELLA